MIPVNRQDLSVTGTRPTNISAKLFGYLLPALIPPIHFAILYNYWSTYNVVVNKHSCTCPCWDTVFKGRYETGIAGYKHMYFNATTQTTKMWVLTVTAIILLYECVSHLVNLMWQRRIRASMLVLFATSLFPHYFTWWVTVNYWNDDFYGQWNHQMFFSFTEMVSTVLVLQLVDSQNPITTRKALGISGIALMHVFLGSFDQFIHNVVRGNGDVQTVVRDLGLMIPDVLHVVLPLLELRRSDRQRVAFNSAEFRRDLCGVVAMVTVGFIVCSYL